MSSGLGIFVKAPTLSPVKTRLGKGVGQLRAEAFYLSSADLPPLRTALLPKQWWPW